MTGAYLRSYLKNRRETELMQQKVKYVGKDLMNLFEQDNKKEGWVKDFLSSMLKYYAIISSFSLKGSLGLSSILVYARKRGVHPPRTQLPSISLRWCLSPGPQRPKSLTTANHRKNKTGPEISAARGAVTLVYMTAHQQSNGGTQKKTTFFLVTSSYANQKGC